MLKPLTSVITLVLLALLCEGVVRVFLDDGMNFNIEMWKYARDIKRRSEDPLIGHEHRPHARSFLMGVNVQTNSVGHRDREIPIERRPGVARIVMLGDSFIEGWGVRFEETISKRLERLFAEAGEPSEVMNTGVGNYNTVMEVRAFLTRDARFKPDLVVLNYTFNDAEPVPHYSAPNLLLRHSEAAVFVLGSLDSGFRLLNVRLPWDRYYLGLYQQPGWARARAAIAELSAHCSRNGSRLMLVSWPELHDVKNYRLNEITERVRAAAREEGAPFVDLLEAVKSEESSKLWVTRPDPHPNGYANQLYANYLFPFLREELKKRAGLASSELRR
ncbi:MAG: SGNH/GDSL hydrolase family protein [Myxococcota bacterium]